MTNTMHQQNNQTSPDHRTTPPGNSHRSSSIAQHSASRRGAALIVALAVMTILLFIGLSFFTVARLERKTAANVANTVRAELLADGALAIAMAFLQHDWINHPTATSIDHAWRTYFNGSWAVGKPWAWKPNANGSRTPIASSGFVEVRGLPEVPAPRNEAELEKRLTNDLTDVLYVPRWDFDPTDPAAPVLSMEQYALFPGQYPLINTHHFATPALPGQMWNVTNRAYPVNFEGKRLDETTPYFYAEQIDFWTDVDNDGDGLNDSIWIPLPVETTFGPSGHYFTEDGVDNDLDGLIDESTAWANDGFDNDGNGVVDAFGIEDNPGDPNEAEPAEVATFLYRVSATEVMATTELIDQQCCDGIDNDNDGEIDEFDELRNWTLDFFGGTNINNYAPGLTFIGVDTLDNDYDLIANSTPGYVFEISSDLAQRVADRRNTDFRIKLWNPFTWHQDLQAEIAEDIKRSYTFVMPPQEFTGPNGGPLIFSFAGEPLCEIIGRMAVKITDEASKVNMNVAGGLTINDAWFFSPSLGAGPMTRVLANGRSPREYETRFMPGIGVALANRMASITTGATKGIALSTVSPGANQLTATAAGPNEPFAFDVSFAGLGRVDDNGDAIWLAMDGADNDGDGMIDEGTNPLYPEYLGAFEGIDDPDEFQLHRPLRNPIAETDALTAESDGIDNDLDGAVDEAGEGDNDRDGATDEIGELGDTYLRTHEQIKLAEGIGPETFNDIRNLITVHSADKNGRTQYAWPNGNLPVSADGIVASVSKVDKPQWQESGTKPHYNYAPVEKIAQQLAVDWGYVPTLSTGMGPDGWGADPTEAHAYLRGARLEGITMFDLHGDDYFTSSQHSGLIEGYPVDRDDNPIPWVADLELHAAQLAANIVDSRDTDYARTTTTISINDLWWEELQIPTASGPDDIQRRDITYTIAGTEAIRINEIMVRPTRRVEAEMIYRDPTTGVTQGAFAGIATADGPNYFPGAIETFPGVREFNMTHVTLVDPAADPAYQTDAWDYPYDGLGDAAGLPAFPLGNQSAFVSDRATYNIDHDDEPSTPNIDMTNMLEFVFEPSPGLPPGNYYLTMNTLNPLGGFADPENVRFLIKTVPPAGQGIIQDLLDGKLPPIVPDTLAYTPLAYTGTGPAVIAQGNLFLYRDPNVTNELADIDSGYDFTDIDSRYTVQIPNYGDGALHVAVWPATDDAQIAVNYFEFSQEPDHEWIELINIQDYDIDPSLSAAEVADYLDSIAIDLSGWQLRIGSDGGSSGLYEIPDGVRIAPGGTLLLGFGKFDQPLGTTPNPIYSNNIALVSNDPDVTVPPFPPIHPTENLGQSVFTGTTDFVDNDGDGARDEFAPDDFIITNLNDSIDDPTALGDRIVALTPIDNVLDVQNEAQMANLVLGGGILPNYPERDGIDNDGDTSILETDLIDNNRNALLFADTDGDSVEDARVPVVVGEIGIDEPGEGIDEGRWSHTVAPPGRLDAYDPNTGVFTYSDGSFENIGTPPLLPDFVNPQPGSYSPYAPDYAFVYTSLWTGPPISLVDNGNSTNPSVPPYVGSVWSAPDATRYDMKALLEQKFHPGDEVPITLYQGRAQDGRIVDQVTYNERDIINRNIDDIVPCPFFTDVNADGVFNDTDAPATLDLQYGSSLWPDDTMGVDFYRSLERKHPLYHGDLHGRTNRWQATDGAYDDWAPSMNVMLPIDDPGVFRSRVDAAPLLYAHAYQGSPLRMNYWQRAREYPTDRANYLYNIPDIAGYPPAINDIETADPYVSSMPVNPADQWQYWDTLPTGERFHKLEVGVRNRPYDSLGDLIRVPNFTLAKYLDTFDRDDNYHPLSQERITGISILDAPALAVPFVPHPLAADGVKFRPDVADYRGLDSQINPTRGLDALAVLSGVVEDPIVLTAAQAEFDSGPNPANIDDELSWGPADNRLPVGWWPVHLFGGDAGEGPLGIHNIDTYSAFHGQLSLPQTQGYLEDHGIFDINALVNDVPSFAAGLPLYTGDPNSRNDLNNRWGPLITRTMYVSGNHPTFTVVPSDPTNVSLVPAPGSEALLVWRGISGLVDGKYDVYVDTGFDLTPLQNMVFDPATAGLFTEFGEWLLRDRVPVTSREEMRIGLKFFTDTQGFRRNQPVDFDRPGDFGGESPEFSGVVTSSYDVFTPDDNGMIYYGEVDVRNGYIAMRIANYSNPGEFARFARLILTPTKRTEGRININTAVTGPIRGIDPAEPIFNPLVGIPGVFIDLAEFPPSTFRVVDRNPDQPGKQLLPPDDVFGILTNAGFDTATGPLANTFFRAERIANQRPEYADGRYYHWIPQLLGYQHPLFPGTLFSPLSEYDGLTPFAQEQKYNELRERYPRLANMVTTRSDVFEIIVTVQSGFVIDQDGDGILNYRDDNEFTSLAEKKVRTVYERQ